VAGALLVPALSFLMFRYAHRGWADLDRLNQYLNLALAILSLVSLLVSLIVTLVVTVLRTSTRPRWPGWRAVTAVALLCAVGGFAGVATRPDGCRQARAMAGEMIGATLVIDRGRVTACASFLKSMDADATPTFEAVLEADRAVLKSGVPYKVVYFAAPFTVPSATYALPPSYPLQLQGALNVMKMYNGTDPLTRNRRHEVDPHSGGDWGLVLVPVNTGYLSRFGEAAADLIRADLSSPRTAAALGLSVSTDHSLRTAAAFGDVAFFATGVTGEFMMRPGAPNLWLTHPTSRQNARAMAAWIVRQDWRRVTIVSDARDGYVNVGETAGETTADTCPEFEPDGRRYSTELAARLHDELRNPRKRGPGIRVDCRDVGPILNLPKGSRDADLCAAAGRGGIASTVRGTELTGLLEALKKCDGDVHIVSGVSATNLVDRARAVLRDNWRPGDFELTYLGYQTNRSDKPVQEHGLQAIAVGADGAYAVWAAVGAARAAGPSWSAPAVRAHLESSDLHVEPPRESDRPAFRFLPGNHLAQAADGGPRPLVFCEVKSVTPLKEHCSETYPATPSTKS
jgi:hypothetical protein